MSLRVCILPRARPDAIQEATGVGRVIYALAKYLKDYDIEVVEDYTKADVFNPHMQKFELPTSYTDAPMILSSHGLYWTAEEGIFGKHAQMANDALAASLRRASQITVPAEWVGEPFRRDMRINPVVIGHGIDPEQWRGDRNDSFIFYCKNRESDVCTSRYAYELARRGEDVISTFMPVGMPRLDKMQVMGYLDEPIVKDRMSHADVYLATTKETFGIGSLEALAAGVPVLGFDWGGTKDIVRHKVDGYLAKPRDVDDLMQGLAYIRSHRKEMSQNARERVKDYTWDKVIGKYASLYQEVYAKPRPTGVSVVITSHNYIQYLDQAISSVLAQSYPVDELIIVDDGSTDGSQELIKQYKYKLSLTDIKLTVLLQTNQGVASARNNGIAQATQPFTVCLDADDKLEPSYIEMCRNEMLKDRATGVVYTGLVYFNDDTEPNLNAVQLTPFNFGLQTTIANPPPTCIPCAAMFRKDLWERVGGYKQRYAPAEDTEFWMRMIMAGSEVKVASLKGLFLYRGHANSASRTLKYKPINDDKPYLEDKQYPFIAPSPQTSKIRSYSEPILSIVLEVKAGQEYNVAEAIDSVLAQSIREWEIVTVEGKGLNPFLDQYLIPYPFVERNAKPSASLFLRLPANNKLALNALESFAISLSQGMQVYERELYQLPFEDDMPNCCGGNGDATIKAKQMLGLLPRETTPIPNQEGRVRLRYTGNRRGAVQYIPPQSPKDIYLADTQDNQYILAKATHVKWLLDQNVFVVDEEPRIIERKLESPPVVQVMVGVVDAKR